MFVPPPLSSLHSHRSSLTAPEHAWASWSMECDPIFIFFSSCNKMFKLFSGIRDLNTVTDFSSALYLDFVCSCLPEFKVNPSQTVTVMSCLYMCILSVLKSTSANRARADKVCRAWAQNGALTLNKLDFGSQTFSGTVRITQCECALRYRFARRLTHSAVWYWVECKRVCR